jgi:hypothetical protein
MAKLANALDNAGIEYIWYVFTNDTQAINNPNIIYMKPRLDSYKWLKHASFLIQLSDTEACSYSINEALYRNIPVVVTPLPYLSEIGVEDGKNAYILEFDCSNVDEVARKMVNVPKFEFKHLEDNYDKILVKSKSKYNLNYIDCEAINSTDFGRFYRLKDMVRANYLNNNYGHIYKGDRFKVPEDLFDYLAGDNPLHKKVIKRYEDKN